MKIVVLSHHPNPSPSAHDEQIIEDFLLSLAEDNPSCLHAGVRIAASSPYCGDIKINADFKGPIGLLHQASNLGMHVPNSISVLINFEQVPTAESDMLVGCTMLLNSEPTLWLRQSRPPTSITVHQIHSRRISLQLVKLVVG